LPEEGHETELEHRTIAGTAVVCALIAGGCAGDDREGALAISTPENGTFGSGELPAAPRLAVGTTAIDLGWVTTGHAARAQIRVDNLGTAPLPAPAVGFVTGSHGDFSLIQDGCAEGLAAGESCELRVQLVPSGTGERAATLELRSDVGGQAQVALNGLGLAAGGLGDFSECRTDTPGECASNVCVEFFLDLDGDGYGKGQPDGISQCGAPPRLRRWGGTSVLPAIAATYKSTVRVVCIRTRRSPSPCPHSAPTPPSIVYERATARDEHFVELSRKHLRAPVLSSVHRRTS
jgi:hypothetical protein